MVTDLRQRAARVLAGGPATLSKNFSRFPEGIAPQFLSHSDGAFVWSTEGTRYIDTIAALGPILLGHNYPAVTEAVWTQAERLSSSSLSTALEVEVAELLVDMIPNAEQVRLASNGADVTNAAVKLMRYVTGKRHVLYCGYHGGHDSYLSTTDKDGGILPEIATYNHQIRWGDLEQFYGVVNCYMHDLAGIIVEVPPRLLSESREETAGTLDTYRHVQAHGGLFVLDEVVTGFRYALGGAQAFYGVTADLATFSKGMANGYKVAAITGPRPLMQAFQGGKVFLSTTFGGECTSLAACKATLETLRDTDALSRLMQHGQALGEILCARLRDAGLPVTVRGNFARYVLDWHDLPGFATAAEWRTLWWQELCKRGVLASVPMFPMACYTQQIVTELGHCISETCQVMKRVLDEQATMGALLECPVIEDVFGQRYAVQEKA